VERGLLLSLLAARLTREWRKNEKRITTIIQAEAVGHFRMADTLALNNRHGLTFYPGLYSVAIRILMISRTGRSI
jgi:hypothetical protein